MIQRDEIVAMFKEFMAEPIPAMVDAFGTDHDKMIAQVFVVVQESTVMKTDQANTDKEFVFPIAKVFNVGDHFDAKGRKFVKGQYVRLRDIDAMTTYNPRYEIFIKNEYSHSNIRDQQIGAAPPKIIQNLWLNFGQRIFSMDPFELEWARRMTDVFYLDTANVVCPIDKPEIFFTTDIKV